MTSLKSQSVHFRGNGRVERLVRAFADAHGVSFNRAIAILVVESALSWRERDDVEYDDAFLDVEYNQWLGTLDQDDEPDDYAFAHWLVDRELPTPGGKRPGAGRKSEGK